MKSVRVRAATPIIQHDVNLFKGQPPVTVVVLPGMQGTIGGVIQEPANACVLQVAWELALWAGQFQSGVVDGAVLLVSPEQLTFVSASGASVPLESLPIHPGQEPS